MAPKRSRLGDAQGATGPIAAARWTLIGFATLGASATYRLLRRCLQASTEAATLGTSSLNQHEFEFGVSLIPPLLLAVALVGWLRRPRRPRHLAPIVMLAAIATIVTGLSVGSPRWAAVLHHVPVVASTAVGTRWWVAWMMALIIGGALATDGLARDRRRSVAAMASRRGWRTTASSKGRATCRAMNHWSGKRRSGNG